MSELGEAPATEPGPSEAAEADLRSVATGGTAARERHASAHEAVMPQAQGTPAVLRREALNRRALALADVFSAGLAVFVGVVVLGDDALSPAVLVAVPFIVLVSKTLGLYDRDEHLLKKTTLDELPALFQVATLYALLLWLAEGAIVEGNLGKGQVFGLWGLLFLGMGAARLAARRIARISTPPERCLVIGSLSAEAWIRSKLEQDPAIQAEVIGRIANRSEREFDPAGGGEDVLGHDGEVARELVAREIDRVVIAPGESDSETVLDTVRVVQSLGVRVSVLPRLFEVVGSSVEFDDLDGTTLLGLRRYGLSRSSRALKRALDIVGAGLGLVVAAPLWLGAAIAIKRSSSGPVLFRQRRIGREGREFSMLKLRTMVEGADEQKLALRWLNEADGLFKIADDPRMTPVGRFLRRTSLDELPQLVNVVRGEMSLVGPRPLVPEEDDRVEGWQRRRLQLYPGMTGIWQVFGSARIPLGEMVKIDYLYAANWSLWLDCKILLQTVPHVLRRRGL